MAKRTNSKRNKFIQIKKMMQKIKDYAKCAIENKLVIGSYIGLASIVAMNYLENRTGTQLREIKEFTLYFNTLTLTLTRLGLTTYEVYKKTQKHLQNNQHMNPRFEKIATQTYSGEVGLELAQKEFQKKTKIL
jgi:hypothetical protein